MVNIFQRIWRHVTGETARQERAEMRQVQLRIREANRRQRQEPWYVATESRFNNLFADMPSYPGRWK